MKAPGTKLLKLKYDEPLSIFAFNFNLRRYIKAAPIDIETIPVGTGMFGGLVTFDTTSNSLFIDADYAWVDDMITVRAKGSFGINQSTTCDMGEWTLEGTAMIIPTSGSIKQILAEVYVKHSCDDVREVYNITGNVSPFDIPEIGMKITKVGRCRLTQ